MKIKLFTLIFSFIVISQYAFSQKYRTLEQFQKYFIDNYKSIDKIEGIWQVKIFFTPASMNKDNEDWYIAIIKEGTEYKGYKLENGYFSPGNYNITFSSKSNNQYQIKAFNYNVSETFYDDFYISNNFFQTQFDLTNALRKQGLNSNASVKWTFIKIFPSESDIIAVENENKISPQSGTGFAISSDGYIITNYHVVENASKIKIKGVNGDFTKSFSAKVMVSDKNNDLAILKIDDYSFTTLGTIPYTIKNTSANVGENIFVLGFPLTATMGEEIKLTNGIISSKSGFQGDITSYQMTAPIQPGNSGAPMFDKDGNIVGIVNAKHFGAENAGYAVKTSYLFNLIDALPTTLKLPTVNTLKGKTLSSQVELANKFVYIIEVE